jgi:hypothetical protein
VAPFGQPQEEEDPTFNEVAGMADRLGLEGDERASYIDDHMSRMGYQRVQSASSYAKPPSQDDPNQGQGPWWRGTGGQRSPGGRNPNPPAQRGADNDRF